MKVEVLWRKVSRVGVKGTIRDIDHRSAKTLIKLGAVREVVAHQPEPKAASTPAPAVVCQGTKADGDPCGGKAKGDTGFCHAHQAQARTYKRRDIKPAKRVVARAESDE